MPVNVNPPSVTRLYNLVATLTQAQKRDFKKYAAGFWEGKEISKYLLLFDIVNAYALSGKDKEGLLPHILAHKDKNKQEKFVTKKAVSELAAYLFDKILESTRTKPEVAPVTNRLLCVLQDINFLFYKGLYEECHHLILEAKNLAQQIDKATYLLELSIWERRLFFAVRGIKETSERLREMATEEQDMLSNLQKFLHLNTLTNDIFVNGRQGKPFSAYAASQIQLLLEQNEAEYLKNLSPRALYWYYSSLHLYHEIQHKQPVEETGKQQDKLAWLRMALADLEAIYTLSKGIGKVLADEEPVFYNAFVDNYLNLCIRLGEFERYKNLEHHLTAQRNELQILRSVIFHRVNQLLRLDEFNAAVKYIEETQYAERLKKQEGRIEEARFLAIRYSCGQAYFILEDYDQASDWFGKIVNGARINANPDLVLVAEIQHIICLFELKVYRTNTARPLNSLYGKLERAQKTNEFLDLLFLALKCAFHPKYKLPKAELGAHIEQLTSTAIETKKLETYFGSILVWLKARCNNTPVADEAKKYNKG